MNYLAQLRAERHLDALIWYLFEHRNPVTESSIHACARSVDSLNAFFDTKAFSVSHRPRNSSRISCACGWSLSLLVPDDLNRPMSAELLAQCLRRMVLHYEIRHNGLNRAGNDQ